MKIISAILLASLTLPLAYAMPTTNADVIRVKQWSTNNAKVNFRVLPSMATVADENTKYVRVTAKAEPQAGVVGTPKTYTANNTFNFYNESDKAETVSFNLEACIEQNDPVYDGGDQHYQSQCGYYNESVSVPAHGSYKKAFQPEVIASFTKPGLYSLTSRAYYMSRAGERRFSSGAVANITVTG